MSGVHSNPQARFPVPNNPLQDRAYYEVNPVPYDVTVERAHAGQDRIRQDGVYYSVPPPRDQERQILEEQKQEGEVAMETYYRVAAEEWEKERKDLDKDFRERSDVYTDREIMRNDPENYEEVAPGRYAIKPGGKDVYGMFRPKNQEYQRKPTPTPEPPSQNFQNLYQPIPTPADPEPGEPEHTPGSGSWVRSHDFWLVTDLIALGGIIVAYLGQKYYKPSLDVQKVWFVLQGLWRQIFFYQWVDWKAGVAAGTYWASSYYLYGPKWMPLTYLMDLGAGRLWLEQMDRGASEN